MILNLRDIHAALTLSQEMAQPGNLLRALDAFEHTQGKKDKR